MEPLPDEEWAVIRRLIERDRAAGLARLEAAPRETLPRVRKRFPLGLAAATAVLAVLALWALLPKPDARSAPAAEPRRLTMADLPLFQAAEDPAAEEAMPTPDPAWKKSLANLLENQQVAPPAPAPNTEVERGDPHQTGERIARAIGEGEVGRFIRQFRQINQEV
ncbi:MAG TPA: hypothetical protein PKK12_10065 [Candidatus Aminicenantes bacterium]|nr:hypothetical protein [Candidatus Aminicenantes bacterium]